jgi:hypothetical protein
VSVGISVPEENGAGRGQKFVGVGDIDDGLSVSGLEAGSADMGNGSTLASFSPLFPATAFSSYVEVDVSNAFKGGFNVSLGLLGLTLVDGPGSPIAGFSMTSQLSRASSSPTSSRSPSLSDFSFSLPLPFENNLRDPVLSRPPV